MKNNNILRLLTVAFVAIGSASQVYGMDEEKHDGGGAAGRYGSMGHSSSSYAAVRDSTAREEGNYFAAKHARATKNELAGRVCRDLFGEGANPWDGSRPVNDILEDLSGRLAGGEAEPLLDISESRKICMNAVVLDMVDRLNRIANPNTPAALWTVCRAVQFLLSNRMIPDCAWLSRVNAVAGNKVDHLIGEHGVVTSAIGAFAGANPDLSSLADSVRGVTGAFELSAMFLAASQAFPRELWENRMKETQRRTYYGGAFAGSRGDVSMDAVFDSAFLNADFRMHVPKIAVELVSSYREVSAAAAINGDRLQRAEQERDAANAKVSILRRFLDGLSCCFRCFCCMPSSRDLLGDD